VQNHLSCLLLSENVNVKIYRKFDIELLIKKLENTVELTQDVGDTKAPIWPGELGFRHEGRIDTSEMKFLRSFGRYTKYGNTKTGNARKTIRGARSQNHSCRGKATNIIYFCVYVVVGPGARTYARTRVALLIQHVKRGQLSSAASLAPLYFSHYLKVHDFRKKRT
jgi:hypothetical protein